MKATDLNKAIKSLDEMIENERKMINLSIRLRLALTVKKHFPEGIDKGHKFFVTTREKYRKGYMWTYRHSQMNIPKLKGIISNIGEYDKTNVLIMDMETQEHIELPAFELPDTDKDIFSFGKGK